MLPFAAPSICKEGATAAAVTFVGSGSAGYADPGGTYNFSGLRDASNNVPTLQQNDVVVVAMGRRGFSGLTLDESTPTGYTRIYGYDSDTINFVVSYKIMGATPDTSLTVVNANSPSNVGSPGLTIHVFRGVDPTNPVDVNAQAAVGSGTANAPAITPASANALIYVAAGGNRVDPLTRPANLDSTTNAYRYDNGTHSSFKGEAGAGFYSAWSSGSFDPDAFGGTSGTGAAVSVALRANGAGIVTAPVITGDAYVGETLTATTIPGASYQWKRDGVNISGATSSTYVTTDDDEGASITCAATLNGSTLTSNSIGPIVRLLTLIEAMFGGGETGDLWRFDADNTDATTAGDGIGTATGLVNSTTMTAPDASNKPTLQTVGGYQCASFDGSGDRLVRAFGSTVSQPGTILIALRNNSTATHAIVTGSSSSSRWQISNDSSDNIILVSASTALDSTFNSPIGDAVLTVELNGASSKFRKNGIQTASGNAGTGGTNQLTVGALWDGTFGGAMDVYAVMFINRVLTSTERADAENYMARVSPATL